MRMNDKINAVKALRVAFQPAVHPFLLLKILSRLFKIPFSGKDLV